MFISLKRYLDSRPDQVAIALLRMVRLILEATGHHAVKGDPVDLEKLRTDIRNVSNGLSDQPAASEVLVMAGSMVKALEQYGDRTTRFVQLQTSELQSMVAMLTSTMTAIASGSEHAVTRLQEIERNLQKASLIEDFQTAKVRLSECLDTLRSEIVRQKQDSSRTVSDLNRAIEESRKRTEANRAEPAPRDPLTGLPPRPDAEEALAVAAEEGRRAFAAIYVVDRVDLINARFGRGAGDQIILFYMQHLSQSITGSDRLFRWNGPSLLAIIERNDTAAHVREELGRIASKRLAKMVNSGGRSTVLPVGARWAVFPVAEIRPMRLLIQRIDNFVQGDPAARVSA